MEGVTAHALGREDVAQAHAPEGLDPEIVETLVAEQYARHYHGWVDEPVPALDGYTPREAAKSRDLRPRVEDLIHGLEGLYERALKDGDFAYDPSWMWAELGLEPEVDLTHPPLLAHERVAGSAEVIRAVAERLATEGLVRTALAMDRAILERAGHGRRDREGVQAESVIIARMFPSNDTPSTSRFRGFGRD